MSSPLAVRVHIPRLEEMNDLHRDKCQVWRHYTSSSSVHRDIAYGSFARRCGTLTEITDVDNAKDIQALSRVPSEGEILILPNADLKVKLALSCGQARLLNALLLRGSLREVPGAFQLAFHSNCSRAFPPIYE